jgi:4-amino-4-deoxy-L-arabinose transferase-like glycosyltransferase
MPVHFDEAQYWAYGQELDWGYFSKPPLVAWLIRAVTEAGGDTLFVLRLASPIAHALIAWLIFLTGRRLWDGQSGFWAALTGRRLWDGQSGFWAAAGYTAAPGVALSAMIISTDPVMMVFWAAALYALVRAAEAEGEGRLWWGVLGALIGAGMMAKYSMLAFGAGALGYGVFSARERAWMGTVIAAGVAALVLLPNILWNIGNDFATVSHVIGDADPGKGYFHIAKLAEFAGAQFAVIGPVFLIAIFLALRNRDIWRDDWAMRLGGDDRAVVSDPGAGQLGGACLYRRLAAGGALAVDGGRSSGAEGAVGHRRCRFAGAVVPGGALYGAIGGADAAVPADADQRTVLRVGSGHPGR